MFAPAIALSIGGCLDQFYGPELTNAFGFDVIVTVSYDSGEMQTASWPACRTIYFGKRGKIIEKLVIEKERWTLLSLGATDIGQLTREFVKAKETSIWAIDSTGIHRSAQGEMFKCKPML